MQLCIVYCDIMGQCCSTEQDGEQRYAQPRQTFQLPTFSAPHRPARETTWAATGIIGLRDQGLKSLPGAALTDVGADAKYAHVTAAVSL